MTHEQFQAMIEEEAMMVRIIAEQVSSQQIQNASEQSPAAGAGGQPPYSYFIPLISPTVTTDSANGGASNNFSATGTVVNVGSAAITARGFVLSNSPSPTLSDGVYIDGDLGLGSYTATNQPTPGFINGTVYIRAYATNAVGTSYGEELSVNVSVCLVEGTSISLSDGTNKLIEDIQYYDVLKVWDFDNSKFSSAKPLYIKKAEACNKYNLLEFSDGSILKTVNQHRIFNKEAKRFTYPMTDETPIGTTTFNINGNEVTLVKKSIVEENVNYYNVITIYHMNLFGNGILTSIGYNNLYPIEEMKFVKDIRELIPIDKYDGAPEKYYVGLRLAEQRDIPITDTLEYIRIRENLKKD